MSVKPLPFYEHNLNVSKLIIISGNLINDEQYQQKLKHSCNFDKKQRSKTNFFVEKTIYQVYQL